MLRSAVPSQLDIGKARLPADQGVAAESEPAIREIFSEACKVLSEGSVNRPADPDRSRQAGKRRVFSILTKFLPLQAKFDAACGIHIQALRENL